jgi:hypothetical protein
LLSFVDNCCTGATFVDATTQYICILAYDSLPSIHVKTILVSNFVKQPLGRKTDGLLVTSHENNNRCALAHAIVDKLHSR